MLSAMSQAQTTTIPLISLNKVNSGFWIQGPPIM